MDSIQKNSIISSICRNLRHPSQQLQIFDQLQQKHPSLPYRLWSGLIAIAMGGSLIYGASLSLIFHRWRPGRSALWLALSAGGSWCLFGPFLILFSRRRARTCAHAYLITMAYGESILISGAIINLLFSLKSDIKKTFLLRWNISLIGISNLVMVTALTNQLRALGVPIWKTLFSWIAVLNGSGALLFSLFYRLLQGDRS